MKHNAEILIELYKRGVYSKMPFFEKQHEALSYLEDNETNEALYGGAARGGKSVLGCNWQLLRRLAYSNSYGLIAREEYSKLRDTTLLTFFKVMQSHGLKKDVDYKAGGIPMTIEFNNGSRIFFREIKYYTSDPEFDRLGSYDLTDAFLDESQQIHYKATQVLKGRFSVLSGEGWSTIPKILYTCNPSKTWVYSEFVKPSKDMKLLPRKKFISALPSDNPYVPKSFFDNLETADEVTKQRLLYGNFEYDDDPSALVDYDAICDMFTNTHVLGGDKQISSDLAMQGRDKFIAASWDGMKASIDVDMDKSSGRIIENKLTQLKNEKNIPNSAIVADSDGLGNYLESYINNIIEYKGGKRARKKDVYANTKSEDAFKLAEVINKREIFIRCTKDQEENIKKEVSMCLKISNLNKDLQKKALISKDEMKKILGHSPDYLDVLIMGMYRSNRQIKEKKPQNVDSLGLF